jgi:hypothetical protein
MTRNRLLAASLGVVLMVTVWIASPSSVTAAARPEPLWVVVSVEKVEAFLPDIGWTLVSERDLTLNLVDPLYIDVIGDLVSSAGMQDATKLRLPLIEGAPQFVAFGVDPWAEPQSPLAVPKGSLTFTEWDEWSACTDADLVLTITSKGSKGYTLGSAIRTACS